MNKEGFEVSGFLSDEINDQINLFHSYTKELFDAANDLNYLIMNLVVEATEAAQTNAISPEAVAVRLLMRAATTYQSVLLLAERGIVADARTLARSLVEDAFMIAAICTRPIEFMELFVKDSKASQKRQTAFVIDQKLAQGEALEQLKEKLSEFEPRLTPFVMKNVAAMGPLEKQYLMYQRLSDDSAHPSATALNHHVYKAPDKSGWTYLWQVAGKDETSATLHSAFLGIVPVAIGVMDLLKLETYRGDLDSILKRIQAAPPSKMYV